MLRWISVCLVVLLLPVAVAAADPVPLPDPWGVVGGTVTDSAIGGHTAYLAGDFTAVGPAVSGYAALDRTTGLIDEPFSTPTGWRPNGLTNFTSDTAGGVYAFGDATIAGTPVHGVVHILNTGEVDPAFHPAVVGNVRAMVLRGGTLYIGGAFTSVAGAARDNAAAVDTTTGTATGFNPDLDGEVFALAAGGTTARPILYAGGAFTHAGGLTIRHHLAAFNLLTGALTGFDPAPDGTVYALGVHGAVLFAGGEFTHVGAAVLRNHAAAFDETTGAATTWDPFVDGTVYSLAINAGDVFLGGYFSLVGDPAQPFHYKEVNLVAVEEATGKVITGFHAEFGDILNGGRVTCLVADGAWLYAAGPFTLEQKFGGPVVRNGLARLDIVSGDLDADWDPAANWTDRDTASFRYTAVSSSHVFLGGAVTRVAGAYRKYLAGIDLDTGRPTAFKATVDFGSPTAIDYAHGQVYVVGPFGTASGPDGVSVARVEAAGFDPATGAVTAWNPHLGNKLGNPSAGAFPFDVDASGSIAYITGTFQSQGGGSPPALRQGFAAVDTSTGADPGLTVTFGDPASYPSAVAHRDGHIVLGGTFSSVNGGGTLDVASLSDLGVPDSGFLARVQAQNNVPIRRIALRGTTIYAAGDILRGDATHDRASVLALDGATGGVLPYNPRVSGGRVQSVLPLGPRVYIGGFFQAVNDGVPHVAIASTDPDTGAASSWEPDVGGVVNSINGTPSLGLLVVGGEVKRFAVEPVAPTGAAATAGELSATVSWVPPTADGGSPVTSYTVTASPGGRTATTTGTGPVTVTGLDAGTSYTFTVVATNAAGDSPPSAPSNAVVPTGAVVTATATVSATATATASPTETATASPTATVSATVSPTSVATAGTPTPTVTTSPTVTPTAAPDTVRPVLSHTRLTHRRFRVGHRRTAITASHRGTTIRFRLSEVATLTVTVRRLPKARTILTLTRRAEPAGRQALRFTGRTRRGALRPGRYRLILRATDAAGNRSRTVKRTVHVL